jgi:hypothetical protein
LTLQRKAFDWFLGENDVHIPVYDFRTKGCNDGLIPGGVNNNQGAESTLSFLLGLLTVIESYTIVDKIHAAAETPEKTSPPAQIREIEKAAKKPISIKSTPARSKSKKQVEELT